MEDNTTQAPGPDESTPQEPEVVTVGFVSEIKKAVITATTRDAVYNGFIDVLVEQKKQQRTATLQKAYEVLVKHGSELNKLRPKSPGFDANEQKLPEVYTAEDVKRRKELKEKSGRLEAAIRKALDVAATEGEWSALENAISKNS
jgi:hypothetical protein